MDYKAAKDALMKLDELRPEISNEQYKAISDLVEMFKPYDGDPQEVWQHRTPMNLSCQNCQHRWHGLFAPAPVSKWATAGQRTSVCPRCYCTKVYLNSNE
jgi:hypothetical protein